MTVVDVEVASASGLDRTADGAGSALLLENPVQSAEVKPVLLNGRVIALATPLFFFPLL